MRANIKYFIGKNINLILLLFVFLNTAFGQTTQSLFEIRDRIRNKNNSVKLRSDAIFSLESYGEEAKKIIPDLIEILRDNTEKENIRSEVRLVIREIGDASSVPELIKIIEDVENTDVLGRTLACSVLGEVSKNSAEAIPALIKVINNGAEDVKVRAEAVRALGEIQISSKDVIAALIGALDDSQIPVRNAAAGALGEMKGEAKEATPKLIAILKSKDEDVATRAAAVRALKNIGVASSEVVNQLTDIANNEQNEYLRSEAADSLKSLPELPWRAKLLDFTKENPFYSLLIIVFLTLLIILAILFVFAPLWIFRINEAMLRVTDINIPKTDIKIPLRYLLLFGFFHYHPRVLNAWIKKHIDDARKAFALLSTVKEHEIYIPIAVDLDDGASASYVTSAKLRPLFEKKVSQLLILGDGGIGKTSLACELGRWAMKENADERLCPSHLMLPILIEESGKENAEQETALVSKIRSSLYILIGMKEKISSELVCRLLKQRRLLLIIDSLSEMPVNKQKEVFENVCDVPVNALIITSRAQNAVGALQPKTIVPQRLLKSNLNVFVESYLKRRKKLHLFGDLEFQNTCAGIISLDQKSEATVLIAKLYINQLIELKERDGVIGEDLKKLAQNIPDLMVKSIKILNRNSKNASFHSEVIVIAAKAIAWKCLEETLSPRSIAYEKCLEALRNGEATAEMNRLDIPTSCLDESSRPLLVNYLAENLNIIKFLDTYPQHVCFTIDPLSEYLASLYLLNKYGQNQQDWNKFLAKAGKLKEKGFILALKNCCISKGNEFKVPGFVKEKLTALIEKIETGETNKKTITN